MATRTRYWRLDSTTGGNGTENRTDGGNRAYESLNAALIAEAVDLVAAGDILHLICTVGGVESGHAIEFAGYTTGPANYIIAECQGVARHNGVSRDKSGTSFQISYDNRTIRLNDEYLRIIGIEALSTGTTGKECIIEQSVNASSSIHLIDFLASYADTAVKSSFCVSLGAGATYVLENVLCMSGGMRGMDLRTSPATVDHCGFDGVSTLGYLFDSGCTVTNCWGLGYTTQVFWTGGSAPSGSNNASDDTSGTDFGDTIDSITEADEFTDPTGLAATADYTLKDGVLDAAGTGSLAEDIAGTAYPSPSDIGPFAFPVGGAPIHRRRHVGFSYG